MIYFEQLFYYLGTHPYFLVILGFIIIAFFMPVPEELVLFLGGYLAAKHQISAMWIPTLVAGILGVFLTDLIPFFLAKIFGKKLLKNAYIHKLIPQKKIIKATERVKKHGALAVFIVRFIPGGIRIPTFIVCGLSNLNKKKFIIASLLGAILSSQFSFWFGFLIHQENLSFKDLVLLAGNNIYIGLFIPAIAAIIYTVRLLYKRRYSKI